MSEWLKWSQLRLIGTLGISYLLFAESVSLFFSDGATCIVNPASYGSGYSDNNECPALHVFLFKLAAAIFEKLGDPNNITMLATIAIAAFTGTLWWSTDQLRKAGDRQIKAMRAIALRQDIRTQESLKAATEAVKNGIGANQIAVTNAERQLRAYVTVQEVSMGVHRQIAVMGAYRELEGPPHTYRFTIILKNGGLTPAINAKINVSHQRFNDEIAINAFHFPDSINFGNALIGPNTIWHTPAIVVSAHEIETPLVGGFHYIYGWVEYDDIFDGSPRHRTEFCFQIRFERIQPTDEPWVSFIPHVRYNAVDGDCMRPFHPAENKYE